MLWYSLLCARDEIIICTPYFVPGRRIMNVLVRQAKAGVKVKVLTQGTDELWFVRDTARQYYDELLAAGAEVFEYTQPHLHTKLVVIDKAWTLFGSANVDIRSQRINHENILCIQDKAIADKNLQVIKNYLSKQNVSQKLIGSGRGGEGSRDIIKHFSEQF